MIKREVNDRDGRYTWNYDVLSQDIYFTKVYPPLEHLHRAEANVLRQMRVYCEEENPNANGIGERERERNKKSCKRT